MSDSSLERVQQDLKLIQSALPSDFPYDRGSVVLSAAAGLCGIPLALRAVPGWNLPMTGILLTLIGGLMVGCGFWLRRARAERGTRPLSWSWGRREALASSIAILGLIVYVVLARWTAVGEDSWSFGVWRGRVAGPALFAFGIGMIVLSVVRFERRSFLGWALAMVALGLAMPWIPTRPAFWGASGAAIFLGGLLSAVLLWWQLRKGEHVYVGN